FREQDAPRTRNVTKDERRSPMLLRERMARTSVCLACDPGEKKLRPELRPQLCTAAVMRHGPPVLGIADLSIDAGSAAPGIPGTPVDWEGGPAEATRSTFIVVDCESTFTFSGDFSSK